MQGNDAVDEVHVAVEGEVQVEVEGACNVVERRKGEATGPFGSRRPVR